MNFKETVGYQKSIIVKNTDSLSKIEKQNYCLPLYVQQFMLKKIEPNKEYLARFDIGHVLNIYLYLSNRYIYHQKNYFNAIVNILNHFELPFYENIEFKQISAPKNLLDKISFEFEALIASFYKIIENPMKADFLNVFTNDVKEMFENIFPTKNNVDSLYWRIQTIRNRVIHMADARYNKKEKDVFRFSDFSAQAHMVDFESGIISIKNTLFDIKFNPEIKKIVLMDILNKKGKNNLFDILFPNKSSEDIKNPGLLFVNYNRFDLINHFNDLYKDLVLLISSINILFIKQIINEYPSFVNELDQFNIIYCNDEILHFKEIFEM
jgi:hypothetical protein